MIGKIAVGAVFSLGCIGILVANGGMLIDGLVLLRRRILGAKAAGSTYTEMIRDYLKHRG
jgi:hypothetical protein